MSRVEVKNVIQFVVSEYMLEHQASQLVHKSELEAEDIARYFRTAGHPLDLTYHEHELLQVLLGLKVAQLHPKAFTNPKFLERVGSYFQVRYALKVADMGFVGENKPLAALIYSPLDDITQLWVENHQSISIIDDQINHEPNDAHFKLIRIVKIEDIVQRTMQESDSLVKDMRTLETGFHPLQPYLHTSV